MPATASSLLLFPEGLDNPLTCRERTDASSEWLLTLRHARIPFQTDHSLMVLHGHPLVLRLGLQRLRIVRWLERRWCILTGPIRSIPL